MSDSNTPVKAKLSLKVISTIALDYFIVIILLSYAGILNSEIGSNNTIQSQVFHTVASLVTLFGLIFICLPYLMRRKNLKDYHDIKLFAYIFVALLGVANAYAFTWTYISIFQILATAPFVLFLTSSTYQKILQHDPKMVKVGLLIAIMIGLLFGFINSATIY